jgi:hypothetical protein
MSTRATIRADLRRDLRDEDATAYIWPDSVLNRHLQHAIEDVQAAVPRTARLLKTVTAAGQRLDVTADVPATFAWVEAVEYPIDRYPQCLLPFREEPGPQLYLLTAELPPAGAQVGVWYAARYTVDDGASDLPVRLERVVLAGALAYACLDQAVDTIARLTPAGRGPADYRQTGEDARDRFTAELTALRTAASPMWRPSWQC